MAVFEGSRDRLPKLGEENPGGSLLLPTMAIEALTHLGQRHQAAALYPLTKELVESGAMVLLAPGAPLVEKCVAIGAMAAERWDEAESRFRNSAVAGREAFPSSRAARGKALVRAYAFGARRIRRSRKNPRASRRRERRIRRARDAQICRDGGGSVEIGRTLLHSTAMAPPSRPTHPAGIFISNMSFHRRCSHRELWQLA